MHELYNTKLSNTKCSNKYINDNGQSYKLHLTHNITSVPTTEKTYILPNKIVKMYN